MRRSRKPLSVVRRIEGSNPSPSAQMAGAVVAMMVVFGIAGAVLGGLLFGGDGAVVGGRIGAGGVIVAAAAMF